MTDYTGLKRLCATLISANEAYLDEDCNTEKQARFHAADDALQDALPPEFVLAIIAENELLRDFPHMRAIRSLRADCADLMVERDQLKAENEALRNALRPLLAHWDDLKAGASIYVDAARAAMGKGEQS